MITISFNKKVEYPDLKEGQVVKCTIPTFFCDGTFHKIGRKIVLDKSNLAYFSIFLNQGYKLLNAD